MGRAFLKARPGELEKHTNNAFDRLSTQRLLALSKSLLDRSSPRPPHSRPKVCRHDSFSRFLDLPAEIRDEIYRFYFQDTRLAAKGQPCTEHATSILYASRQLHREASAIMLREASFTLHLDRQHTRHHDRDIAYYLDHPVEPGAHFRGRKEVFELFRNFDLRLDAPKWHHRGDHWQRSAAAFISTENAMATMTSFHYQERRSFSIRINIGSLQAGCEANDLLHHLAADMSDQTWSVGDGMAEQPANSGPCSEGKAEEWKALYPTKRREAYSRFLFIHWLGQIWRQTNAAFWLESHDHGRRLVIETGVENALALLKLAAGFADGRDVWLVVDAVGRRTKQ
ncbi:hypothetical protein LTS10_007964 [Elasticomyces elasticus]|nr:hypothetical protein LTS10_007964 [Elasticomyces elasticus]